MSISTFTRDKSNKSHHNRTCTHLLLLGWLCMAEDRVQLAWSTILPCHNPTQGPACTVIPFHMLVCMSTCVDPKMSTDGDATEARANREEQDVPATHSEIRQCISAINHMEQRMSSMKRELADEAEARSCEEAEGGGQAASAEEERATRSNFNLMRTSARG